MVSSELRRIARERLNGKWGKAVSIMLAYILITFIITFIEGLFPEKSLMATIVSIAVLVIEIPLSFGLSFSFFKLFYGEDVKAFDFWKLGFDNFKRAWGVSFRTALKLLAPALLVIGATILLSISMVIMSSSGIIAAAARASGEAVSSSNGMSAFFMFLSFILIIVGSIWGTFKAYYYLLAQIVAFDNTDLTPAECILKSKDLMTNNRLKLFYLQFSFVGWALLTCFTFGIGVIWLAPYMELATIAFYDSLKNKEDSESEVIVEN